jgi:hypothetical protein
MINVLWFGHYYANINVAKKKVKGLLLQYKTLMLHRRVLKVSPSTYFGGLILQPENRQIVW